MSFFDEADEPETTQRAPRRPRGRPPADQQAIQTRRIIAVVGVVIVIVLIALLVHSCAVSSTSTALKDYNNGVYSKMQVSVANGMKVLKDLSSGEAKSNLGGLMNKLANELDSARSTLSAAQRMSVPNQMSKAQQYVLLSLTMRRDGIRAIAENIQSAMSKSTSKTGIQQLQQGTSALYGSDMVYKSYAVPAIAAALKHAGVAIGPTTIYGGQVVQDLAWLDAQSIATMIGAESSTTSQNPSTSGKSSYTVQAGDTLSTIAQSTGVPVATLEQLNPGISPDALTVGQTLRLH